MPASPKNRAKGAFSHIAGVVRNGNFSSALRMTPDFMAAGTGPVKLGSKGAKPSHDFAIRESRQTPHRRQTSLGTETRVVNVCGPLGNGHGNSEFGDGAVLVPEDRRKRVTILAAGFRNLSSQALRNFHGFRHASALRHQPRNVRTGAQVAAVVKVLYADANRHFLNFCQVFLPSHGHHPLRKSFDKFYHAHSRCLGAFLRRQSLREKLAADLPRWRYRRGGLTGLELTTHPLREIKEWMVRAIRKQLEIPRP